MVRQQRLMEEDSQLPEDFAASQSDELCDFEWQCESDIVLFLTRRNPSQETLFADIDFEKTLALSQVVPPSFVTVKKKEKNLCNMF